MRSKDHTSLRIVDLWTFKSTKSNKRYIVEVEGFEHEFYGHSGNLVGIWHKILLERGAKK